MSIEWQRLDGYGFSLFPIPRGQKRPVLKWGDYQHRRPGEAELAGWARSDSNAGIVTGQISGIIVLDVDSREGAAEVARRGLPRTPTVRTARGRHYYLRHPGGRVGNFAKKLNGCDLRGDGGFAVAPGSVHPSGVVYTWVLSPDDVEFAGPPAWLLELVRERPGPAPTPTLRSAATAYAETALDRELAGLRRAAEGTRNERLNRAAFNLGQIVGAGALDEVAVERHLLATAHAIGLGSEEARATVRSGLSSGKAEPRRIPDRGADAGVIRPSAAPSAGTEPRRGEPRRVEVDNVVALARQQSEPAPAPALVPLDPIRWYGLQVPQRRWLVDEWMPMHAVTAVYGDGGVGKTLLAQQLATACAVGKPWLGLETLPCRVIMLLAEDPPDELHRRQAAINALYDIDMCDLERLRLFSRVGDDNGLMIFPGDVGKVTSLYHALVHECREFGAQLLIVDTAADTFLGNENIRSQVRQFIGCLNRIALTIDGAALLTAHPSVAGMATRSGYGGSTAWNASVRSRLYLDRPQPQTDKEPVDPAERVLSRMKANYAGTGEIVRLRWQHGVFKHVESPNEMVAHVAAQSHERTFLDLLGQLEAQGRTVTDATTSPDRYAPRVMSQMPSTMRNGLRERDLAQAMTQLFAHGSIKVVTDGAPSRGKKKIVRAG